MSPVISPSHGKRRRTVTEDTSTVRAMQESEERYRLLIEHAPVGILTCDRAGNILTINQKVLDLMGSVSPEFTLSVNILSFPSLIEAGIAGDVAACLATGKPVVNECYYVSHWEKKTYLRYNLMPIRGNSGDIVGVQAFLDDLTGHRRSAEALLEREVKYRTLFENAGLAIFLVDIETGAILDCNANAESLIGRPRDEITRMIITEIHPPEGAEVHRCNIETCAQRGYIVNYKAEALHKDGRRIPIIINATPVDVNGKKVMMGFFLDVTERTRMEEALLQGEEHFRAVAETASFAICILQDGRFRYINPAMEAISGYTKEELQSIDFKALVHPEVLEYVKKRYGGWLDGISGEARNELKCIRKDGEVRWADVSRKTIDYAGKPALLLTGIDITERKRAEMALQDSEERLRLCAATARLGTFDWDLINDRHVWSAETNTIYGLPPGTHLDREMLMGMIYPGDRLDSVFEAGLDPLGTGEYAMEYRIVRASDGAVRWVNLMARVIFEGEGVGRKAVRVLGVIQDITERKQADAALRESEEKFRALAETSRAGILLYRGERLIYNNPVLEEISGYASEELLRMRFWDLIHPDHRDIVRGRGLARQRGQPVPSRYEAKIIARDGKEKWLEFAIGLINYAGEPTGIATLYDITERKRAEEALAEAKATAELYLDLMGHDINNMNQISMGFMEMARQKMEFEGKLTMDDVYLIDKAIESVRNSSNLIRNVRKLQQAKLGIYGPEMMDLGKMLIEVAALHEDIPGRKVSINCAAKTGCYVMANELLEDVFINLVGNAIKHSRGPLEINIQMNETHVDGQAWWKVVVDDNGPGIPDSQKQTLFDRLNLSVSRARGKGFGLCLIKLLIDGYHGDFRVEDRVSGDYSKGARFVVTLPAVTPEKP